MNKVMEVLAAAQAKLNAPKDKNNSFGKYKYRNAEGIIAAYKALDLSHVTALTMSDTVAVVGSQIFLTATATFTANGEQVSVTGCAMHALDKKGMDSAQITGAASSYARKYALCGLFAIDDSEHDADSQDNRPPQEPEQTPAQIRDGMWTYLSNQRTMAEYTDAKSKPSFKAAFKGLPEPMQNEIKAHGKAIEVNLTAKLEGKA